mgnify:CR=1 FL=1
MVSSKCFGFGREPTICEHVGTLNDFECADITSETRAYDCVPSLCTRTIQVHLTKHKVLLLKLVTSMFTSLRTNAKPK